MSNGNPVSRRFSVGINSLVFAGLAVIAVVLVNVLSSAWYKRFDITEDNLYTLSSSSKKLVSTLPRDLKVKLFVSEKLLPGYRELARYLQDLLDEYKNASKGRFKWELIRPEQEEKYRKEAERYSIKPFVAKAKSANALEARSITFGLAIIYKPPGRNEEWEGIPRLLPGMEQNLEYMLSERIKRLAVKRRQILFLSGHNQFPAQAQAKVKDYMQELFKDYDVQIHDLKTKKTLPDNAEILVMLTPQTPVTEEEAQAIDQFVMKGKAALFLVDGMVRRQERTMMQQPRMPHIFMAANTGLEALLKGWGVTINHDIVMDHQLQLFPTRQGMIFHPAIPAVRVPKSRQTVTPFLASSLAVNRAYLGSEAKGKPFKVLPLLVTSQKAWTQKPPFIFNLQARPRPQEGEKLKAYLLAAAIEGRLPSYTATKKPNDASVLKESKGTSRVAVVGDADMLWLSRQMAGNQVFLRNLMDWLAQDETLVKLRGKMARNRDLEMPEGRGKIIGIKLLNIAGVPLLVVLLGIFLWLFRGARRSSAKIG